MLILWLFVLTPHFMRFENETCIDRMQLLACIIPKPSRLQFLHVCGMQNGEGRTPWVLLISHCVVQLILCSLLHTAYCKQIKEVAKA